jgi:t-SNARE complex subunit (syntaxin)
MNVADKYQDVLTLEASVAELHQMFLDFALLTEQQGELLDQIEHQVKAASEYIEEANVQMVGAIALQKSIRAKQCCICTFILVVIGIIVGVVVAYKQQQSKS